MSPQQRRRDRLRRDLLSTDPDSLDSLNDRMTLLLVQDMTAVRETVAGMAESLAAHARLCDARYDQQQSLVADVKTMRHELDNPDGIHHLEIRVVTWITGWYEKTHDARKALIGLVFSGTGIAGAVALARHFGS